MYRSQEDKRKMATQIIEDRNNQIRVRTTCDRLDISTTLYYSALEEVGYDIHLKENRIRSRTRQKKDNKQTTTNTSPQDDPTDFLSLIRKQSDLCVAKIYNLPNDDRNDLNQTSPQDNRGRIR